MPALPACFASTVEHLTGHVMPFWVERAIDREHGGITNIITDDGRVTSTEKYNA